MLAPASSSVRAGLLTAFQVIDDAAKVRIVGPQGRMIEATEVLAWNRRQDWLILKVALDNVAALERAPVDSATIGDRLLFSRCACRGQQSVSRNIADRKTEPRHRG